MNYDDAKADVLVALCLPEVGQLYLLKSRRKRIWIIIFETKLDRIRAYRRSGVNEHFFFTRSEWWQHANDGSLILPHELR